MNQRDSDFRNLHYGIAAGADLVIVTGQGRFPV
jgi:hypothetical protein